MILFRSYVKQIRHNGNLYIDDYVLRVGVDFFHWVLWWLIMPGERLSHWLSVTYHFDMGIHSTTFSEEVIWKMHIWSFLAVILIFGFPLLYWYKYRFRKTMKISINKNKRLIRRNSKNHKEKVHKKTHHHKHLSRSYSFNNKKSQKTKNQANQIKEHLLKGLVNLEIMVQDSKITVPLSSWKTQKTK